MRSLVSRCNHWARASLNDLRRAQSFYGVAMVDLLTELLTLLGSRVPQRRGPIQWHAAGGLRWRWWIWPHEGKISSPQDD